MPLEVMTHAMRFCFLLLFALAARGAFAAHWIADAVPRPAAAAKEPVWLRCFLRVPNNMTVPAEKDLWRDSVTLSFAEIPAPFTVFLNGQKIVESAPIGGTARRFKVPKGILQKGTFNALALRVENGGAIGRPPVLAGYFDELVLSGEWQRADSEPGSAELQAASTQPANAFFIEKQFRKSVTPLAATEPIPGQRLPPAESLAKLRAGEGLLVEDILHEPLIAQPTHLSFDDRGRLWVAQYRQYPYPAGLKQLSRDMFYRAVFDRVPPAPPNHDRGADRITVHADTDGDGVFDEHKTVLDGLNMANAALRGRGGIWVMHTPYLLFYPDQNGDDIPDGPPETRLAGFGLEDTHSVANGLTWGPDGWLYGGQGSTVTCRITRPGTDSANSPGHYYEGCMVWRYHPETRDFEIFAEGGGNTFGLEFDAEGRLFSGHNGGDTRGWHFIPGGIYLKQGKDPGKFGPPASPYALGEFSMLKSAHPIPRFTHNIIVADGIALPAALRGRLLGTDPLHRKITVSELLPAGPTLSTNDTGVALSGEDIAFRPVYLTNAPDGSVYLADFYEEFIAHGQNYQGQLDPSTGRVYRLRAKDAPLAKDVDLSRRSASELVETLRHPNRWHRQTAVRLLGERRDPAGAERLRALLREKETHPSLEALWALHQSGALDEQTALGALEHPSAHVRAWSIRLVGDAKRLPPAFSTKLRERIKSETDPIVRAQIAATARRLPANEALPLVAALARRDADADDPFVPLLCWWTLESHLSAQRDAVLALLREPGFWSRRLVAEHLARRVAVRLASPAARADFLALAGLLGEAPDPAKKQLVAGFEEAFKGRALPPLPEELLAALAQAGASSPEFRIQRGEAGAIQEALRAIAEPGRKADERLRLIRALGDARAASAQESLLTLAGHDKDAGIRAAALNALTNFAESSIGEKVAGIYGDLPSAVRPAAIALLASRDSWQAALIPLLERGTLAAKEVPAHVADRLRAGPNQRLAQLLPASAATPIAPQERMDRIKTALSQGIGDAYAGEKIYDQRCASCHQLFHKGGQIGPNLTAYQRDDLGTMLTSIITPNAEIREGYENVTISTKDGRVLGGFVTDKDAKIVILRGFDGQDTALAQAIIADLKPAGRSLMPDGLIDDLTDQQLRDFFAYLRSPQPISK